MDNLKYTYLGSRIETCEHRDDGLKIHQLNSVAEASGNALGYSAASGSYTYDANGNQISDGANGFTVITCNHLNLPTKFTQGANTIEIH